MLLEATWAIIGPNIVTPIPMKRKRSWKDCMPIVPTTEVSLLFPINAIVFTANKACIAAR
jgi:hypothetical protein